MAPDTMTARLDAWAPRLAASKETISLRQIEVQDARSSTPGNWDAKIYELTQELTAIRKVEASLLRELDLAHIGRRRAQNALARISRIPDTVLADIFFAALTSCGFKGQHAFLGAVTSTSHLWRDLALNSPRLWCKIVIGDESFSSRRTRAYFHRSANALLDLTIDADIMHTATASMEMRELMRSISPHLQRCKHLTLITSNYEHIVRSMLPIRYPMPKLRTFTWKHLDFLPHPLVPETSIIVLDGSACSPASVHVDIAQGSSISFSINMGSEGRLAVRDLSIMGGDIRTMREHTKSLRTYPNLQSLTWAPDHADGELNQPSLQSDSVEAIKLAPRLSIPRLFDRMSTPCLRHLVLSGSPSPAMDIQGDIGPFPHLRTLWFETGWFSRSNIRQILRDHPSLEAIGSSSQQAMLPVIRMLAKPVTMLPSNFYLPRLSSLHIIYRRGRPILEADVLINEEWQSAPPTPPAHLRNFDDSIDGTPEEMRRVLRALIQDRTEDQNDLEIRLNDFTWTNLANIPQPFEDLALEYPKNVSLSSHAFNPDYTPHVFFPV